MIYKFTYDGELVRTHGELGVRGRGPNTFDRPTDIAWLPDGTYFISDGYGGTRVAKFDPEGNFIMDWGQAPADPQNPGPNEFNTPQHRDQRRPAALRRRPRAPADAGLRRERHFLDMWPLRRRTGRNQNTLMVNHFIDRPVHLGRRRAHEPASSSSTSTATTCTAGARRAAGGPPELLTASRRRPARQVARHHDRSARQPLLADCFAGRVQKFEPIPGADRGKSVGRLDVRLKKAYFI
jgi:hypothetical protein